MANVLIVDDDVVARTTLALLLSHRGMAVQAVGSTGEALAAMRSQPCDVVLLDQRLPDGQGTDLIAPLRAARPGIGVIIVTGHAALDSAVRALEEGADAYVAKPAAVNEVVARIEAVTERQRRQAADARVERALRESEARLRALIENIADIIMIVSDQGAIQYLSGSAERVLGYPPTSRVGQNVLDYVHPDDARAVREALSACLARPGHVQPFMARVRHVDGSWRDLEGTGLNRLHDPSVGGIVLNCRDVTERRRAEGELRHLVELGNLVAHVSSLFISSPSSTVDAAIQAALEAVGVFSRADRGLVFRVDAAQIRLWATHEWCAPGVPPRLDRLQYLRCADVSWFMRHMRAGEVVYAPDVERLPVEGQAEQRILMSRCVRSAIAVPMTCRGTLMGALTFQSCSEPKAWSESDITVLRTVGEILANVLERQYTEEQLIQSAKMASLGIMAGGIAHELRNPLGVIYAAAQLMRDRPRNRALRKDGIERILAASCRASAIIDGLLTFARPADGQMHPTDVRMALADALALVDHRLAGAGVRLVQEHAPELPPVVGNPAMLTQVFANLLLNACNAMPDGGTLVVTTRATEGWVEVGFADSGVGIPPENLPRVFDPFFTTMPVGRGTGLGLTISYGIVQRHRGTIVVDSQPSAGTRVTVRLPADAMPHGGDNGSHTGGG